MYNVYCTHTKKPWWSILYIGSCSYYLLFISFFHYYPRCALQPRTPTELSQPPLTNAQGLTPPRKHVGINKFNSNTLRVSKNAKTIYTKMIKHKNIERESFQTPLQHISLNSRESRWNTLLIVLPSFILVPTLNTKKSEEKHEFI